MKRVIPIVVAIVIVGGLAVGFVLLTNEGNVPASPPPPVDSEDAEPPADQDPPPEPPPDPAPLLTLTGADLWWDIGGAECVATGGVGETLVPTLTVCVRNDGDGEAEVALLANVVSDVENLSGTPYDEAFAAEPLAPGEERCLSATVDPATVTSAGAFALASGPDAQAIPLALPDMPPLCEPEHDLP